MTESGSWLLNSACGYLAVEGCPVSTRGSGQVPGGREAEAGFLRCPHVAMVTAAFLWASCCRQQHGVYHARRLCHLCLRKMGSTWTFAHWEFALCDPSNSMA